MTDKEFIENYILKDWVFSADMSNIVSSSSVIFGICSSDNSVAYPINEFIEYIKFCYGEWYCDIEKKLLSEIIKEWFENEKCVVLNDINEELTKLNVILGSRNWVCVDENGETFFWKKLVLKFKDKYDKSLIRVVYDEWFQNKVFETSEKIMNSPWS